jgi:hypothetical protein
VFLELRILKELFARISELRILNNLATGDAEIVLTENPDEVQTTRDKGVKRNRTGFCKRPKTEMFHEYHL